MDGSIWAKSHFTDLSHETKTLVKPLTEVGVYSHTLLMFMLLTATALQTFPRPSFELRLHFL